MPYVVDVTGRGPATATLARRGVIALALLAALVTVLLLQYRGAFRGTFPVRANVADVGDGVTEGADVKLRGVLVGSVRAVHPSPRPGELPSHDLDLDLQPAMAAGIPSGVTARVVPTNVFGAPSLELLDPPGYTGAPGTRYLTRGEVIPGDSSAGTLQLQTVLNQFDRLLLASHPAELNVALTNLSQALQGRGAKLGSLLSRGDRYLTALNGHTDDFTADLRLLDTTVAGLANTAPELLDTVQNAVVTAKTVVDKREQLARVLSGAIDTTRDADDFVSDNSSRIITLLGDGADVTRTLAGESRFIPISLTSIGQGTRALATTLERPNGNLNLSILLTPFRPYTAADCPRYPGLAGPNCGNKVPPTGPPPIPGPSLPGSAPPGAPALPKPPGSPAPPSLPGLGRISPDNPPAAGDNAPRLPGADSRPNDLFGGLFPGASPSGYTPAPGSSVPAASEGGLVGPVGGATEARTVARLMGGSGDGSAAVLLLGPLVRGATVVVS